MNEWDYGEKTVGLAQRIEYYSIGAQIMLGYNLNPILHDLIHIL